MKSTAAEENICKSKYGMVSSIALNPNPLIAPLAIVLIGRVISSAIVTGIVTPLMYKLIPPGLENDDEKA
ncbi:MAG TPA: hypothetical protein VNX40_09075 [Mucilaginibacter sp.]|jgi:hypothetical protein|nr:hypothetical protein [Mucilaginibacter sp.]